MNPVPIVNDSANGAGHISYRYRVASSSKTSVREIGASEQLLHSMTLNSIPKRMHKALPQETMDTIQMLLGTRFHKEKEDVWKSYRLH